MTKINIPLQSGQMKRINKTDKKVLGKKKSTLTWFLYFGSGAKATASLMQRVVHFTSYFLKLEFLIAICLHPTK